MLDPRFSPIVAQPLRSAVFVDYDGSLAPIVARPEDAVPLPSAATALGLLVPLLHRVAVVSGRTVGFLQRMLALEGVEYVGLYGMERLVHGVVQIDPRADAYAERIAQAAGDAERALPGVLVERKGPVSVTLHWRATPDREAEVRYVATKLAQEHGLDAPQRGRMAVELRPPVPLDKGAAVAQLLDGVRVAAFAGDDAGDLPAFDALDRAIADGELEHAVRIAVHSSEGPPELRERADVVVQGPAELAECFSDLAAAITAAAAGAPR